MPVPSLPAHQASLSRNRLRLSSLPLAALLSLAAGGCAGGVSTSASSSGTPVSIPVSTTPVAPTPVPTPPAPAPPVTIATVTVAGNPQTRLSATAQFTATITGSASKAITWKINGVSGGSSSSGLISSTGLYTAPAVLPLPNVVTVSAVNPGTPVPGALMETILNPIPAIVSATAIQAGASSTYRITVIGSQFINGAQIQVAGAAVTTSFISTTQLTAALVVAPGTTSLAVDVINPISGNTPSAVTTAQVTSSATVTATVTSASRLLDQATFGPVLADIGHVAQIGIDAYITEQFLIAPTLLAAIPATPSGVCTMRDIVPCEQSEWWQAVMTGPDQLRQRVAFALSEIMVVSSDSLSARAVTSYQNMLARDAFTNFSTIMKDVSLSPAMGGYLNMLNSNKPAAGQIANENYPRELMQLFTTGIDLLNADGSLQLDSSGNPIPVYSQTQVQAFARAYTGWTYASYRGAATSSFPNPAANYETPMAAVETAHDTTSKILLNGTVLPSGQSAEQDLNGALANIFNHPNVGPFVCRQLIQHLVASSPSPAYVARVAGVFANDGIGVRGDMQAVVRAILEDPEARAGDTNPSFDGGHLREAMLYMTGVLRGLGFSNISNVGNYGTLSGFTSALGEQPYNAGSVFNFFPPSYVIPATAENAPEFGQENTASAILRLTLADRIVNNGISNFNANFDAASFLGVKASKTGVPLTDAGNLVDALGKIFMHNQMPTTMRTEIVNHVAGLTNIPERVRVATYLVITSSEYKIEN